MIRVCLMRRDGRKFWECQWRDAVTGRKRTKSTGTALRRDAERFAARLETDLNTGDGVHEPAKLTWDEFRDKYDAEKLRGLSRNARSKVLTTLNAFGRLVRPAALRVVGAQQVSEFVKLLRAETIRETVDDDDNIETHRREETTIVSHLCCLRSAFRWAHRQRLILAPIHIEMPKRPPGMKGRPVTAEEFERMLAKVPAVVPDGEHKAYAALLTGLWWSGLRLGEAMQLHWTSDENLCVVLSGKRPMFFVRGHAEKGRKNRLMPVAPEFAEILLEVPESDRRGFVFLRGLDSRPDMLRVSKLISAIGREAGVRVSPRKFASAHDLRRAFGLRWAFRVMPPVLQELMRHESIATTMEFYVGTNAEATADAAWKAVANGLANTASAEHPDNSTKPRKNQRTR